MAENEVKNSKNRVIDVLTHEWKYENLILVILALFAIELGVLLLAGDLAIQEGTPILGKHSTLFAWILIGLGAISVFLAVFSFYKPSVAEIKHLSSLSRSEFFKNVLIVVVFSLILALMFVAFDGLIEWVVSWFK